ncbi:MAG TPA: hypothetical protein VF454_06740 [Gemmatimonadales bacterium]
MTCRILMVAWCLVLGSSSLAAQQAALRPRPSSLFVPPGAVADTTQLAPTYWKEGALIGGIPMAILGAIAGHDLCEWSDGTGNDDCILATVGTAALSGGVGAIVGALIGGQFHKKE